VTKISHTTKNILDSRHVVTYLRIGAGM